MFVDECVIFRLHGKNSFPDVNGFGERITGQISRAVKKIETNRINGAVIAFRCFVCHFPFSRFLRISNPSGEMTDCLFS